ncbi:MAG: glycoside hydrolase family 65 protein [Bacteroidota bacterium]
MKPIVLLAMLMIQLVSAAQEDQSGWIIPATDIDPNNYYGITVANGMMGIVSSPHPLQVEDVVLNGVYDYYQRGRVSNILKTFNHVNMYLDIDGHRVAPQNIANYAQTLDMKRASLTTTFDVGDQASIRQDMMALRHLPYTALIHLEIQAKKDIEIIPHSVIEAPNHLSDVRNYYSEIDRPHVNIPLLTSVGKSPSGKHTLAVSNSFIFEEKHGTEPDIIHEDWDYNRHLAKFKKKLKAGETYRFSIVASACSSEHYEDPHNEAERLSIYAMLEGYDRLIKRHEAAWEELWKSDIIIEGDPDVQRDIRSALYHLYAFAREGTALSLSPMGLSGLGYNGHVFWDTELWMYPPILMLQPAMARSLLDYRYERLEMAKQNAFAHGYKGAMYPWESAGDGSEDTPVWALTGPFEHHITGCVAWATWKYYQVTQDREWLEERGYPMLREIAEYWVSRVEKGADGQYHINNVVGADEWAENVDDNAFTNAVAMVALRYATDAAKVLGRKANARWMEVADQIVLLQMPDGITREHATYQGEEIKQADVNLLAYPLQVITEAEQVKRDLLYYEARMSPTGPAMAHSVLSILYNQLGDQEKGYELLLRGFQPNRVPPFGVLAETAGGTNPYFATGAGGTLQAVLAGFAGLEITDQGIRQSKTQLPKNWKSLTITGVGRENKTYQVK